MIDEIKSIKFKSLFDFGCGELTNFFTLVKTSILEINNFMLMTYLLAEYSEEKNF